MHVSVVGTWIAVIVLGTFAAAVAASAAPTTLRVALDSQTPPLFEAGTTIAVLLSATRDGVQHTDAGSYITFAVPRGAVVVGVDVVRWEPRHAADVVVEPGAMGLHSVALARLMPYTAPLGHGDVEAMQGDTGLFFSVDPRTAVAAKPHLPRLYSRWDMEQVEAFGYESALSGNKGRGAPVIRDATTGRWRGLGSMVAGPHTFYTNDYSPAGDGDARNTTVADFESAGPWQRIECAGSRIAGREDILPSTQAQGFVQHATRTVQPFHGGHRLSARHPLPRDTNAIRAALGEGVPRRLRVSLRIEDADAFVRDMVRDRVCAYAVAMPRRSSRVAWAHYALAEVGHCFDVVATLPVAAVAHPPSCVGALDGRVAFDVLASEQLGPFTYQWNGGSASALKERRSLRSGRYYVVVNGTRSGRFGVAVAVVDERPPLKVDIAVRTRIKCHGDANGALLASVVGGTPPYELLWLHSGSSEAEAGNLTAGTYSVAVRDSLSCEAEAELELMEPAPVVVLPRAEMKRIHCRSGSIQPSAAGGAHAFWFRWFKWDFNLGQTVPLDPSDTDSFPDDPVLLSSRPGRYCAAAMDRGDCTSKLPQCWDLERIKPLIMNVTAVNLACRGASLDVQLSGGVPPYRVAVNESPLDILDVNASSHGALTPGVGSTFSVVSPPNASVAMVELHLTALAVGQATVKVTDAWGCVATHVVDVPPPRVPPLLPRINVLAQPLCFNDTTGTVEVVVANMAAFPNLSFVWSDGSTARVYAGASAGLLNVTVMDADQGGCAVVTSAALAPQTPEMVVDAVVEPFADHRCVNGSDATVSLRVAGGAAPFVFSWSHGATVQAPGPMAAGEYSVLVMDSAGCAKRVLVDVPSQLHVNLTQTRLRCGDSEVLVNLTVSLGTPPYSFEWLGGIFDEDVWAPAGTYNVTVTDASGCQSVKSVVVEDRGGPFAANLHFRQPLEYGGTGSMALDTKNGVPPLEYEWSDGRRLAQLDNAYPDAYSVTVADASRCILTLNFTIREHLGRNETGEFNHTEPSCPMLHHCFRLRDGNDKSYMHCLRRGIVESLWNLRNWDVCAMRHFAAIGRHLEKQHGLHDTGATYVAMQMAEMLHFCEVERGPTNCNNFTWDMIDPFVKWQPAVWRHYECFRNGTLAWGQFRSLSLDIIFNITALHVADVLVLGPYAFNNEYVFAPSLHFPTRNLRVSAMLMKNMYFKSSAVTMVSFPWTLQVDIELASAYLRDLALRLRPRYIIPGDSAAILMTSKLAWHLYQQLQRPDSCWNPSSPLVVALQSSIRWPPEYPPATLSKLIEGHEPFAPQEVIVTDDDAFRTIGPNYEAALEAVTRLGTSYLKREYSEASRGVARVFNSIRSIREAFDALMTRDAGVSVMDLDIKVRLFLQKEVALVGQSKPLGFRFYAERGRVLAGHISAVTDGSTSFGVTYVTVRDEAAEQASIQFVKAINYTGFGAAWWWKDVANKAYLIDFNSRMERHACITPILGEESLMCDPCYVFQRVASGELDPLSIITPGVAPAGLKYMEPLRALQSKAPLLARYLVLGEHPWNMWRKDTILWNTISAQIEVEKDLLDAARILSAHMETSHALQRQIQVQTDKAKLELQRMVTGWSALHYAAQNNDTAMVALLLRHNADPNARDANDVTPLLLAVQVGNIDMVKALVDAGADHKHRVSKRRD